MTTTTLGTTNEQDPFKPGETIDFCGDHFVVEVNHGNSGRVREAHGIQRISPFYWSFEGEACHRVITAE